MIAYIQKTINVIYIKDQKIRKSNHFGLQEILDKTNSQIIRNLVMEHGYISKEKYGKIACKRAWVLVQHGRKDNLAFMKHYLKLINTNLNDFNKPHYAYLLDKILFLENKPQVFGTQFILNNKGVLTFDPIENKKDLDKRRSEYRLEKFEDYEKMVRTKLSIPI